MWLIKEDADTCQRGCYKQPVFDLLKGVLPVGGKTSSLTFANNQHHVYFLYAVFILLYRVGISVVSTWNPKARKWKQGRKNVMEKVRQELAGNNAPIVWMHCASLGEFEQGRPLFERILQHYPLYKGIITFFSPSGFESTQNYAVSSHTFYLPFGSEKICREFVDILNPSLVLWVKYEYWLYYLKHLYKKKIPTLLVSAHFRPDQPFFKWYGKVHRQMLHYFTYLFVQTESSRHLLETIGYGQKTILNGDTRFDRVLDIAKQFEPLPAIAAFCQDTRVIVAGSTWLEDEEEMEHYANTHPGISFVIAPHEIHPDRLREMKVLFKNAILYSDYVKVQDPVQKTAVRKKYNTLIVDNIGMLSKLYHYATIAYVGGGFGEEGVHNILEAAVYGKPVIFGPVFNKYTEAIELLEEGGAITIETALELEKTFDLLITDEKMYLERAKAAQNYVYSKDGATRRILSYIQANRLLTS